MGHKVLLGTNMQAQVDVHHFSLLQKKLENGLLSCEHFNYDQCIYKTLEKHMNESYGCIAPWVVGSKVGICTDYEKAKGAFEIAWNRVTNQKSDCPNLCEKIKVFLGGKNTGELENNDKSLVYLYFQATTQSSQEHLLYIELNLFAEIGGYLGLLLGYSLLSFAQFIGDFLEKKDISKSK